MFIISRRVLKCFLLPLLAIAPIQAVLAAGDLSGTYDVGTLTPLERPVMYGDSLFLSKAEGEAIAAQARSYNERANSDSNPARTAPPAGGAVGGYNMFWIDRGEAASAIDGKFRTSIITAPKNGRIPAMTPYGKARMAKLQAEWRLLWRSQDLARDQNTGQAWWLKNQDAKGPYDDIEQRPLAERCILGSRSTAGPPMLPNLYNNHKRIIQTPEHVMILTEMNHDARIIRLEGAPRSGALKTWLGDSVGRWEGETLVVETKNFGEFPPLSGADATLTVTEYFSRQDDGGLLYRFTIDNPKIWQEPWGGEYPWQQSDGKLYEYACHEGNYAIGNIMRGARELEREALGSSG